MRWSDGTSKGIDHAATCFRKTKASGEIIDDGLVKTTAQYMAVGEP